MSIDQGELIYVVSLFIKIYQNNKEDEFKNRFKELLSSLPHLHKCMYT